MSAEPVTDWRSGGNRRDDPAAPPAGSRVPTPPPDPAAALQVPAVPVWTPGGVFLGGAGEEPLTAAEAEYIEAARARNTLRGYRSCWNNFDQFCVRQQRPALPTVPATVSAFIIALAQAGAKVSTISKYLTTIKLAHTSSNLADPTAAARVQAVWSGIRRRHGAPLDQAPPLMPPQLDLVVDACPTVYSRSGHPDEPSLAGARDRALLLLGFHGAFRRSELAALTVEQIGPERVQHEGRRGRVITLHRSKTNQEGLEPEYIGLLRMPDPRRCPLAALDAWLELADISSGPVLRRVTRYNSPGSASMHPESLNDLVHAATERTPLPKRTDRDEVFTAHSLRAGFVTYLHLAGATDREIAVQTRHGDLASVEDYIRVSKSEVFSRNAVTRLGAST